MLTPDSPPGLDVDKWGRTTLHTRSGAHYTFTQPGVNPTVHDVDLCLEYAGREHPEDVDELLDARIAVDDMARVAELEQQIGDVA